MPHECYMALDGFYDMNDYRLIVYYKECNKSGFNAYATNELMKKPLFIDFC
jgi:hypothetical protein